MGHSPSIMDYSRFNYVAQPEDRIPLAKLVPDIGPWDKYITHWGYTPIPAARTPDEEWATLDRWSREQDSIPWYRFNMSDSRGADPGDQTEAVGDADPVKATGWGMRSIKQIMPLVVPATVQQGHDFDDLDLVYSRLIGQWATELRHVTIVVGGTNAQEKYGGQAGPRYVPLSRARQKEAVQFLNENAFATPTFFLDAEVLRKIEVEGALRRINAAQASVINALFNDRRLERVIEFDALADQPRRGVSAHRAAVRCAGRDLDRAGPGPGGDRSVPARAAAELAGRGPGQDQPGGPAAAGRAAAAVPGAVPAGPRDQRYPGGVPGRAARGGRRAGAGAAEGRRRDHAGAYPGCAGSDQGHSGAEQVVTESSVLSHEQS